MIPLHPRHHTMRATRDPSRKAVRSFIVPQYIRDPGLRKADVQRFLLDEGG
jgi:hypothetical protein